MEQHQRVFTAQVDGTNNCRWDATHSAPWWTCAQANQTTSGAHVHDDGVNRETRAGAEYTHNVFLPTD